MLCGLRNIVELCAMIETVRRLCAQDILKSFLACQFFSPETTTTLSPTASSPNPVSCPLTVSDQQQPPCEEH